MSNIETIKRRKRLAKNTVSSLAFQVTTIVCGFILPRLILVKFGSEVNGLVNSITQFMQIIAFLELGVGAVVQSSLYKPLADRDEIKISKIIASAGKFFKKFATILLIYVIILIIVYPYISNQNFSFLYTATLIAAMSISSFAQYYFGVVDRLLLTADQKGYIQYTSQTATLIINTIACYILIEMDGSIQLVKLVTSLIFLLRPLFLRLYVNKKYNIDRKIEYEGEPIKQKWNGVAQHIASIVLDSTDNIVLTIFSTLSNVSIYSVYHLVIYGVKQLFTSLTSGIQSLIGELWAKKEIEKLESFFGSIEWSIHVGTTIVFCCTGILVVPFVSVYTYGVTDANYVQPLFAILITLANALHCLRLPYNIMILAGGHYKQTQHCYIIAALLNMLISIVCVIFWGLVGVAIGTIIAMIYQTIWMVYYNSKNFIKRPIVIFFKLLLSDVVIVLISTMLSTKLDLAAENYYQWVILAIQVSGIVLATSLVINLVFYREKCLNFIKSKQRRK